MNLASWIILIIVAAWIFVAIKCAFFGGFGKKGSYCHGQPEHDDDTYKITFACSGCDKKSCGSCSLASKDIPTPIIHEVKWPRGNK